MASRALVYPLDARNPSRAAKSATLPALRALAPARDLVIAAPAGPDKPGRVVAPWTRSGIAAAAARAGLAAQSVELLGRPTAGGGDVAVEFAGAACKIPRSWLGAHLCLAVPCVLRRRRPGQWSGPLTWALEQLGRTCRRSDSQPLDVGALVAAHAFASVMLVVDATWATALQPGNGAGRCIAVDRCLVAAHAVPDPRWVRRTAQDVDAWIASATRLTAGRRATVEVEGPAARRPWPRLAADERRIAALWPPQVRPEAPGPMARLWHAVPRADVRSN